MMFHIGKDDWYQWMDTLFTNFDRCACDDFVEFMFQEVTGNHLNLYRLSLLCVCLYCACVLTVYVCTYCAFALTMLQSSWTFKLHYLIFQFFSYRCAVILLAPIAVLKATRTSLLASNRDADIEQYFSRTQCFNLKALCKSLITLLNTTPPKHLTGMDVLPMMIVVIIYY